MIPFGGRTLMHKFFLAIGQVRRQSDDIFNLNLHLAVAAGVVVIYDWGEQDVVLNLLPFL
jgi:hypothetical protein